MATKKQIQAWIPLAKVIFCSHMGVPISTLPEIHIVGKRELLPVRSALVEKTGCHQRNTDVKHYDSIMEALHGDLGDAILIQQSLIPSPKQTPMAEFLFRHFLWHEFGHFYAIRHECPSDNLHRFNDQALSEEKAKQHGYWFWSEFIAESISLYVEERYHSIDRRAYYHPELIAWEPEAWGGLSDKLLNLLEMAFTAYPTTIDEKALAMYFATLLMDDATKRYVRAAEEGLLRVHDPKRGSRRTKPGGIEPTCISDQPEACQNILWEMKEILEKQMAKEHFWEIDENWLEMLGQKIVDMESEKIALLAAEMIEQ